MKFFPLQTIKCHPFFSAAARPKNALPPRVRFNYLALGGGGVTVRVTPGLHLLTGLKWIHVSNGGLAGRSRNPDIEAVGLIVGSLIAF